MGYNVWFERSVMCHRRDTTGIKQEEFLALYHLLRRIHQDKQGIDPDRPASQASPSRLQWYPQVLLSSGQGTVVPSRSRQSVSTALRETCLDQDFKHCFLPSSRCSRS